MSKPTSVEDIVYDKLKKAIIFNKFPPNYKLVESDLAKLMNVSRTPVRTALKLLEKDGLLAIIPNKGAFITKQTYKDIRDSFLVRVELEKISVRLAVKHVSQKDLEKLESILTKEKQAYREKNRVAAYTLGADFHKYIAKLTNNRSLYKYVSDIIIKTDIYDVFYILNDPMLERKYYTPEQHFKIYEALREKDREAAEEAMEAHLMSTENQLNLLTYNDIADLNTLLNVNL